MTHPVRKEQADLAPYTYEAALGSDAASFLCDKLDDYWRSADSRVAETAAGVLGRLLHLQHPTDAQRESLHTFVSQHTARASENAQSLRFLRMLAPIAPFVNQSLVFASLYANEEEDYYWSRVKGVVPVLVSLHTPESTTALVKLISDGKRNDGDLRAAFEALGTKPEKSAVDALVKGLSVARHTFRQTKTYEDWLNRPDRWDADRNFQASVVNALSVNEHSAATDALLQELEASLQDLSSYTEGFQNEQQLHIFRVARAIVAKGLPVDEERFNALMDAFNRQEKYQAVYPLIMALLPGLEQTTANFSRAPFDPEPSLKVVLGAIIRTFHDRDTNEDRKTVKNYVRLSEPVDNPSSNPSWFPYTLQRLAHMTIGRMSETKRQPLTVQKPKLHELEAFLKTPYFPDYLPQDMPWDAPFWEIILPHPPIWPKPTRAPELFLRSIVTSPITSYQQRLDAAFGLLEYHNKPGKPSFETVRMLKEKIARTNFSERTIFTYILVCLDPNQVLSLLELYPRHTDVGNGIIMALDRQLETHKT